MRRLSTFGAAPAGIQTGHDPHQMRVDLTSDSQTGPIADDHLKTVVSKIGGEEFWPLDGTSPKKYIMRSSFRRCACGRDSRERASNPVRRKKTVAQTTSTWPRSLEQYLKERTDEVPQDLGRPV